MREKEERDDRCPANLLGVSRELGLVTEDLREDKQRLIRRLPVLRQLVRPAIVFIGGGSCFERAGALREDAVHILQDRRKIRCRIRLEEVDDKPVQLPGDTSELGLCTLDGPRVDMRDDDVALLRVEARQEALDELRGHFAALRRLVVRDDHDEADEEEVRVLLHEPGLELGDHGTKEFDNGQPTALVDVGEVLDKERHLITEATFALRVVEEELE